VGFTLRDIQLSGFIAFTECLKSSGGKRDILKYCLGGGLLKDYETLT